MMNNHWIILPDRLISFAVLGFTISSWIPLNSPGMKGWKAISPHLLNSTFDNWWLLLGEKYLISGSVFFLPALWRAWRAHHSTAPGALVDPSLGSFSIRWSGEKRRLSVFSIRRNFCFGHNKWFLVFAVVWTKLMHDTYQGACFICGLLARRLFCSNLWAPSQFWRYTVGKYVVTKQFIPLVYSPRQPKLRRSGGNSNCTLCFLLLVLGHIFAHV